MLWKEVGSIAVGPITTTATPAPEPSSYRRPGVFHAQVCSPNLRYPVQARLTLK